MADEAETGLEEAIANKPSKLPVILMLVNLLATGAVAYLVVSLPKNLPGAVGHAEKEKHKEEKNKMHVGPMITMDPFVVNLNEEGSSRYLKVQVELELKEKKDEDVVHAMEGAQKIIRDELLRYLSGLKVADTQGEEGKTKIREQILARINQQIGEGKVSRVFFNEFVVQ